MSTRSESTVTTTTTRTPEPGPWRWWLLLVGLLPVLTLLTWGFATSVERATVADAEAALAGAGLTGVTVDGATYRDLTLTGPAADEDAALAAVEALGLSYDVAYVPTGGDDEPVAEASASPSAVAEPSETAEPSNNAEPSETAAASAEPIELPDLPDLAGIQFETGSAVLTAASTPVLDQAAAAIVSALESRPGLRVSVEGHTDSQGDPAANLTLSQQRADAVLAYLATKGVPAAALSATGYGDTAPIADNSTDAGRAANRRVDFTITEG